jgi:NgoMIV restriction enzyme
MKNRGPILAGLTALRREYHRALFTACVRLRDGKYPNMADTSSKQSVLLAQGMIDRMKHPKGTGEVSAQALGSSFAEVTADFLRAAFGKLRHVRPGDWTFSTSQGGAGIARFAQYAHITQIQRVLHEHPELRASLGGDYLITPDIVVARAPLTDEQINVVEALVNSTDPAARLSPLRAGNVEGGHSVLHASISMKWTMRSDRSQNTRTEALNLIRNRKGSTPQIVVVTFEPLPSRLASIAMGTGDIDCTYHAALDELLAAARDDEDAAGQLEILEMLVQGQRLRDISDLALDLAV